MEQNTFDLVAGARPNFMKLAPLVRALVAVGAILSDSPYRDPSAS